MTTMHVKSDEVKKTKEMHIKTLNEFWENAKPNNPRNKVKVNIKKEIFKALDGCCYNLSKEILEEIMEELGNKSYVEGNTNG